jgi:hypothetical protein
VANYERFIVVGDNHGDMQDDKAVAALFEFMRFWKPKHRLHLGDNWDLRWLRSKASEDDKLDPGLQADFDAGYDFLRKFKPTVMLLGNHDARVIKGMESPNSSKRKLCEMLWGDMEDAMCGVKPLPYNKRHGVYRFGDTNLVHGYAAGIGAVRKHALVYGKVWMGHIHAIEAITTERHDSAEGRSIGALCRREMGYNDGQIGTLRQDNGFLYGLIFPSGKTLAWQAQWIDGVLMVPSEMREVKCA